MQSGISASEDLHAAFNTFTSDTSLFCLPVTIESESLTPLPALPFTGGSFPSSLPTLTPHLQAKSPIYLLIRKDQGADTLLTAITYVPSTSPVRSKTLFASTRQSLLRQLGLEKFEDTLFVTEAEEVTDPREWEGREKGKKNRAGGPGGAGGVDDTALLSTEERELQSVKRAEEEERHGTSGKQLGGQGGSGLAMRPTDEARNALQGIGEGELVQLGLGLQSETVELLGTSEVPPDAVSGQVPSDRPSYNFYRYPGAGDAVLFIYVCPARSKVKERMMYASSRNGVIDLAKTEGLTVSKRMELDAEDITAERLAEEAGVGGQEQGNGPGPAASGRGGFARPKRPGKR